jgi:ankyrin repeat protein
MIWRKYITDCALDTTKEIVMKCDYSIKNKFLVSIAIGSFILSIFAGNTYASPIARDLFQARLLAQDAYIQELIRRHGDDINRVLLQAIWWNDVVLVQALLARGANPNAPVGPNGETAINLARQWRNPRMIALLLNHNNNRALYLAVKEGDAPAIRALRELGADPYARVGLNGETAIDLARRMITQR